MSIPRLVLDAVSAAPLLPEVFQAMQPWFEKIPSLHEGQKLLREAMQSVSELIKADAQSLHLIPGGGQMALPALHRLAQQAVSQGKEKRILVGEIESEAIMMAAEALRPQGFAIDFLPVNLLGQYEVNSLEQALKNNPSVVALQFINRELGTIQPVQELAAAAHGAGALFFCDVSFGLGRVPMDLKSWGGDTAWASSFGIFGGPVNWGFVWNKVSVFPSEASIFRSLPDWPGLVGVASACESAYKNLASWQIILKQRKAILQDALTQKIESIRFNGSYLDGSHLLSVSFEGLEAEALRLRLDLKGVSVEAPAGCLVRSLKVPRSLRAIGLPDRLALSTLILGLHIGLSEGDISQAAEKISDAVAFLRNLSPS